jgi:hypothetical protein
VQRYYTPRSGSTITLHDEREKTGERGAPEIGTEASQQLVLFQLVIEGSAADPELSRRLLFIALGGGQRHDDKFALDPVERHADVDRSGRIGRAVAAAGRAHSQRQQVRSELMAWRARFSCRLR